MKKLLVCLALLASLPGCATLETVANAPLKEGIVESFPAKYDAVNGAMIAGLASLNVDVKSSREQPEGTVVLVLKSLEAWSWGEVGRIFVERSDSDRTNVYVRWEKRSRHQITGTDAKEFSDALFQSIRAALRKS